MEAKVYFRFRDFIGRIPLHCHNVVHEDHAMMVLRLIDDEGDKDKIVIFNMMYAKCEGICRPVTRNLVRLQKILGDRVGKDIFMYSFTLKPKDDTPAALKHYAHMHKVKPGWLFLTGSADDMETLRRKLGYVDPDPVVDKDFQPHRSAQVRQRATRTMGRLSGNAVSRMDRRNNQLG